MRDQTLDRMLVGFGLPPVPIYVPAAPAIDLDELRRATAAMRDRAAARRPA